MYEKIFYLVLVYIVVYILYCFYRNLGKEKKANQRSSKKTQEYIAKKIKLENKYCNQLPLFNTEGRANNYGNSWNNKTGKFSPEFTEEFNQLNEEYNMPNAKKSETD